MRVPEYRKEYFIITYLLKNGPTSLGQLADSMARELSIKFTTARSAVTRIIDSMIENGLVKDVGTDKRGSRLVDVTPHLLWRAIAAIDLCDTIDPEIAMPAIKRLCPELIHLYEDYIKILKLYRELKSRIEESERSKEDNYSEEFGFVDLVFFEIEEREEGTCEDVKNVLEVLIKEKIKQMITLYRGDVLVIRPKKGIRKFIRQYAELSELARGYVMKLLDSGLCRETIEIISKALEDEYRDLLFELKQLEIVKENVKKVLNALKSHHNNRNT